MGARENKWVWKIWYTVQKNEKSEKENAWKKWEGVASCYFVSKKLEEFIEGTSLRFYPPTLCCVSNNLLSR